MPHDLGVLFALVGIRGRRDVFAIRQAATSIALGAVSATCLVRVVFSRFARRGWPTFSRLSPRATRDLAPSSPVSRSVAAARSRVGEAPVAGERRRLEVPVVASRVQGQLQDAER